MDNWKNILDEDILKPNALFAAVFVLNYECLEDFIVDEIKKFYCTDICFEGEKETLKESNDYNNKVRALYNNQVNASLKWYTMPLYRM